MNPESNKIKESISTSKFYEELTKIDFTKDGPPAKCDQLDWYDLENLPENTLLNVKTALDHIKNNVSISEMREEI